MDNNRFVTNAGEMDAEFSQCKTCVHMEEDELRCSVLGEIPLCILVNSKVCGDRQPRDNKQ